MALDSLGEHLDGGAEVLDAQGRPVFKVVTKHQAVASTDTYRGTRPADPDGRPHIVLVDANGNDIATRVRSDSINVIADYGAKGDGTTDDTAAVAAAMTAGNARYVATGGITDIVLSSGYKFLLSTLTPKSGVRLRCYGAAITPNMATLGANGLIFLPGAVPIILTDFEIAGGTWLGTGSETGNQLLFMMGSLNGLQDVVIRDTKVINWGVMPYYLRNPTRVKVLDNTLLNPGVAGQSGYNAVNLVFDGGAAATGETICRGNIIEGSWSAAIAAVVTSASVSGALRLLFEGNIVSGYTGSTMTNSGAIGCEIDAAATVGNVIIRGNDIDARGTGANARALLVGANFSPVSQKIIVSENNVKGLNIGISVYGGPDASVVNNRIDAPTPIFSDVPIYRSGNRYSSSGAVQGRATLSSGTVTVSTAEIQASDNVLLSVVTPGGTRGEIQLGTIVAGTSFVINSIQPGTASTLQASDTSTVFWQIVH